MLHWIKHTLGKKNLLLMGVQGFYWCAWCCYFSFLVLYLQNHGYSNVQCAQTQVFIAIATLVAQPFIGYLTDTYVTCKKYLLATCALAIPVAFLLQMTVANPILCYAAIILQALLFYPTASIIDSWTMALKETDPQVQYPVTRSAGSVLYSITALVFGNVIAALGDGIIAPSFVIFAVLMFLCVLFLEETPCSNKGSRKDSSAHAEDRISGVEAVKLLMKNRIYVFFILSCLFYNLANKATGCFISNYVADIGGDSGGIGLLLFFSALVEFPAMMFMGKFIKRYSLNNLHLVALSGVVIKNLFFFLASSMPLLVIGQIAQGLSYGCYVYIYLEFLHKHTPKQLSVTAITLGSALSGSLGGIVGNYLAGVVLDTMGLSALSIIFTVVAAAGILAFLPIAFSKKEAPAAA